MTTRLTSAYRSYAKTAVACFVALALALTGIVVALQWVPAVAAAPVAALGALATLGAAVLVCASAIVLIRCRRDELGKRDLFLELNRSREPDSIKGAKSTRPSRLRRWLVRRLLGHDLVVGELVEVKSWAEIRETLDEQGCLEQLPFMPEMLPMCGQRARVFRCVHRLFDYRKTRRMRQMHGAVLLVGATCDGSNHGGCEAACHTIWKSAWLRRVGIEAAPRAPEPSLLSEPTEHAAALRFGSQAPRYACQLTRLHDASYPIERWNVGGFLKPLVSGNVAPAAFVVGWLTYLFNELQHLRQGVSFPAFETASQGGRIGEETRLENGASVVVRPAAEIRATLNDQFMHRGLWFEPDMLKHCGREYRVQAEVTRLIDIVTGEMLTMKTPAYILREVHFSGERQLFNAQYEPLFWRAAWLQRADD